MLPKQTRVSLIGQQFQDGVAPWKPEGPWLVLRTPAPESTCEVGKPLAEQLQVLW